MHPLHEYLAQHQDKALQQDRVVVFYDARSEFEPCLTELEVVGTGIADLPRAEVTNFGHKFVHISDHYVRDFDRLLTGGI